MSGSQAERPGLTKALEMLREGDTLVVRKLDRLGRSVRNLVDLVGQLHQNGVQFKSLTDAIDTGTPSGRFFFHVMASLAEMERELTLERTMAGLEIARQLGRKGGRKRQMTDSKIVSAKKTTGQRCVATRCGKEPWSVRTNALSLDSSLITSLAYDFFRFLRRPHAGVRSQRRVEATARSKGGRLSALSVPLLPRPLTSAIRLIWMPFWLGSNGSREVTSRKSEIFAGLGLQPQVDNQVTAPKHRSPVVRGEALNQEWHIIHTSVPGALPSIPPQLER